MNAKNILHVLFLMALSFRPVFASSEAFDFKDPKGVNAAQFRMDAPLESIEGSASGVTGTILFDPTNPAVASGKIIITSASLVVPNPLMNTHLLSDKWLDAAKYPEISFEAKEFKDIKTDGDVTTASVTGVFECKGTRKELTIPVKFTYLKGKLGERIDNMKGDLLVIRAKFSINRADFNINPGQYESEVSNTIEITLSVAGAAVQSAQH